MFSNGNDIRGLVFKGKELWAATGGGVVRFNVEEGSYRKFTTLDGLCDNDVRAIALDKQGVLWFGTEGSGVSSFDGENWHTFTIKDGLVSNYISVITIDAENNVWAGAHTASESGTKPGGLSRYDGTKWRTFSTLNGFPNSDVTLIYQDMNRNFWIGFGGYSVKYYVWVNNLILLKEFSPSNGPIGYTVEAMVEDKLNHFWFSGKGDWSGGISSYDGITFHDETANVPGSASVMFLAGDGKIWFGGAGVKSFNGSQWLTIATRDLLGGDVTAIAQDQEGNMWFGTGNGIIRFNGKQFDRYLAPDNLVSNVVRAVVQDKKGNMLFGTYNGISSYGDTRWQVFFKQNGLPGYAVTSFTRDGSGIIWSFISPGVVYYDGILWQTFPNKISNNLITSVAADKAGNVWFGTVGNGVVRYDGQNFKTFTKQDGLLSDNMDKVFSDNNGTVWITKFFQGINSYDGTEWKTFIIKGLDSGEVTAALKDNQGVFWFGTTKFVLRSNGSEFGPTIKLGTGSGYVTSIFQDSTGNIWFGTYDGGVAFYDGTAWRTFTTADGLSNNHVTSITQDDHGNLWFGTLGGVSSFRPE